MPPLVSDRVLYLAIPVFLYLVFKGIRYAITDIVQLTEIDPAQFPSHTDNDDEKLPEDAIDLNQLKVLASSPNPNIANSAVSLLVQRYLRSPANPYPEVAWDLATDLQSEDERVREQAECLHRFIKDWPVDDRRTISEKACFLRDVRDALPGTEEEIDEYLATAPRGPTPTQEEIEEWARERWGRDIAPSAEQPVAGWVNVPREMPLPGEVADGAGEEAALRRRRREAMVITEGGNGYY